MYSHNDLPKQELKRGLCLKCKKDNKRIVLINVYYDPVGIAKEIKSEFTIGYCDDCVVSYGGVSRELLEEHIDEYGWK